MNEIAKKYMSTSVCVADATYKWMIFSAYVCDADELLLPAANAPYWDFLNESRPSCVSVITRASMLPWILQPTFLHCVLCRVKK